MNPVPVARPVLHVLSVERQDVSVSVQQPVWCPVVSPVPFVLNVRGQSQKKDGSPSLKVNTEINFVRSAFSVHHCVFAPIVSNAHNVANAQLVGGCKSESSVYLEGMVHSPIQKQTTSSERYLDSQWFSKPLQEPLPEGGCTDLATEGGSRDGEGSNISSLLQQTVHSSQTKPKMATGIGPQCSKQIFERKNFQNGNPRDNSDFLTTRGMGDIAGFQRRLFPHPSSHQI